MFRRRSGYTPITKHSQILDHKGPESDTTGYTSFDHGKDSSNWPHTHSASNEDITVSTSATNNQTGNLISTIYTISGYRYSAIRSFLFHVISILLIGIPYLLISWFPSLINLKYLKSELRFSDFVLVSNDRSETSIEQIIVLNVSNDSVKSFSHIVKGKHHNFSTTNEARWFIFENIRYILNNRTQEFERIKNLDEVLITNDLLFSHNDGVSETERDILLQIYGENAIEIAQKSYWELFCSEILNPFYLFQIFSIVLWCLDEYYYYAGCVFFLSGVSIFTSLYETRKQRHTLYMLIESLKADNIQILCPNENVNGPNFDRSSSDVADSNSIINISPDYLVPGDIFVLPADGGIMACDALLLFGSCIVNESMLTGESVPVTKTPPTPTNRPFEWNSQKRHILYAGTTVLQTRYFGTEKVLAKVVRTGFTTSKGELIKSILYPRPIGFRFYEDSVKFIIALFGIAAFGMAYCIRLYMARNVDVETILLRTLDIITIVIPPALPLAMTAGTVYSQARLKKQNIFCISPQRINVCGKLKLICFDKTGTLTDDGLTMDGCIECRNAEFQSHECQLPRTFQNYSVLVQILATCHSLTTINGTLHGDPLDIEMFGSIDWELIEPGQEHTRFNNLAPSIARPKTNAYNNYESQTKLNDSSELQYSIGIIKQFQFSSELQCMTVIVRVLGEKHMKVFTKGAPEKILSLCNPNSIPNDYYNLLNKYTSCGYRVIALAHKNLSKKIKWTTIERMKRDEIETDLIFVGFLILLNRLKPETTHIIEELQAANLRTVMITGDNIMTALSVAKDCKIIQPDEEVYIIRCANNGCDQNNDGNGKKIELRIELCRDMGIVVDIDSLHMDTDSQCTDSNVAMHLLQNSENKKYHFALDGTTWNVIQAHYSDFIPHIVARGTIFARFRPEQKSQIVTCMQQFDYIVAMCGDGANDCGALKAAHIGISLSQAEASVAAPFTSKDQNITCVKYLALEGRCALVTSFGLFKYMTMYSLIQFSTILILYSQCSILGNFQFLYIDLIITASLAFTMGRQGPATKLVAKRPSSSLLSLNNVIPLLMHVSLCASIQIAALLYLYDQEWYMSELVFDERFQCSFNNASISNFSSDDFEQISCWENTVIFLVSCFQYLILGIIYSKGPPYRRPVYTNILLIAFATVLTATTLLLLLQPPTFLSDIFEIQPYNSDKYEQNAFRINILLFPLLYLVLSVLIEFLVVDRQWFKKCVHILIRKSAPKNRFKKIELEMLKGNQNWLDVLRDGSNAKKKSSDNIAIDIL